MQSECCNLSPRILVSVHQSSTTIYSIAWHYIDGEVVIGSDCKLYDLHPAHFLEGVQDHQRLQSKDTHKHSLAERTGCRVLLSFVIAMQVVKEWI
jgi:hypothetical protein